MLVELHADDLGASRGVTDSVLACVDDGPLRRASVLANGTAFAYAAEECRPRRDLTVALHLNLVEGCALAPASEVDLLVDDAGRFRRSFAALWTFHARGGPRLRERLQEQVRIEFSRQIERFQEGFPTEGGIELDSHQHYHLLPFVFDAMLQAMDGIEIRRVRVTSEPWFVDRSSKRRGAAGNVAKHGLLRLLSARAREKLRRQTIPHPDRFVGLLYTGSMTASIVEAALAKLESRGEGHGCVEVLFHPGGATQEEAAIWADQPELADYYLSTDRVREAAELCSPRLRDCIGSWT